MQKDYKFMWSNGVSIEQSPLSLILKYSDLGDHVTNHYTFRIPLSMDWPLSLAVSIDNNIPIFDKITWMEVPEQVCKDALNWLNKNLEIARNSNKDRLESILNQLKDKIEKEITE
jgi:hypothetical protein